jgi:hypothetical protein
MWPKGTRKPSIRQSASSAKRTDTRRATSASIPREPVIVS